VSAIESLSSRISSNDSDISSLSNRIDSNDYDISSLSNRIDGLRNDVGYPSYYEADLETRIDELRNDVGNPSYYEDDLETQIDDLKYETSISDLRHDTVRWNKSGGRDYYYEEVELRDLWGIDNEMLFFDIGFNADEDDWPDACGARVIYFSPDQILIKITIAKGAVEVQMHVWGY